MLKLNKSSLTKGLDGISEKKKEGNIPDIESDHQSSNEGDVDDSSKDRDSEDSHDADIENSGGINEEKVQRYVIDMEDICFTELFGINNQPIVK